jgi:hypothetical protein
MKSTAHPGLGCPHPGALGAGAPDPTSEAAARLWKYFGNFIPRDVAWSLNLFDLVKVHYFCGALPAIRRNLIIHVGQLPRHLEQGRLVQKPQRADLPCPEIGFILVNHKISFRDLRALDLQVIIPSLALLRHTRSPQHCLEHPLLTFLEVADNDIYVLCRW